MLKIGTQVTYRDRSNHKRYGVIDRTSAASGQKLYRINGRGSVSVRTTKLAVSWRGWTARTTDTRSGTLDA